tara:strand:+ start:102 stop:518 length:417 start_codon:yes stop_codon:yes gene_type:complete
MQPGTDQWGQPAQPVAQPQYGQPPQQQVIGQPATLVGQPTVGVGVPMGMGYPPTQATAALVLSILGLVMCGICTGLPGLILANGALAITNQYPNHPDSGSAKAAMIIGWIVVGLTIVGVLFYLLFFVILAAGGVATAA